MNQKYKTWIFATLTLILFVLAIVVYPLSVYFGEQTNDPDKYEAPAWFAALGLLFLSLIFVGITSQMYASQQNRTIKLFGDAQL